MNTSRIFWGTLWIVTGALILLTKLDLLSIDVGSFWKFWPLVLVLWGISLLTGAKAVRALLAVLAAVVLALVIYGAWEDWGWGGEPREMTTQTFVEKYDATLHRAALRFVSGAGAFTIGDTTADLFRAETTTNYGKYEISASTDNDEGSVSLRLGEHFGGFRFGGRNVVTMKLHPSPLWRMDLQVGAARMDADLSPFAVDQLDVKAGAGDVRVKLGERAAECSVDIQAGASSIRVEIPDAAACEIRTETGLSSKSFPGFEKQGDGTWRTGNFDSSPKKIYLRLKAGVSSLRVERY